MTALLMIMIEINDYISYFPKSENPLSAEVGVIRGKDAAWIFDVGASDEAADAVNAINCKKNIILSHFHYDHSANVKRVRYDTLMCGHYAKEKFPSAVAVYDDLIEYDGVKIHIFPLPSSHAKGCLGLEVNGEYAFLGDAVYGSVLNNRVVFNVTVLKETIKKLSSLEAKWFIRSHNSEFIQPKENVLDLLSRIYALRKPQDPYISLKNINQTE